MKILIISGGYDREREVSLWSAANIQKIIKNLGHGVEVFDLKDEANLEDKLKDFELAFPILHGKEGEGGNLQKKLENWGVEFIGPSSKTCLEGWDKFDFKKFCEKREVKTPKWQKLALQDQVLQSRRIDFPFIIKPADEGSSVDVFIVKSNEDLDKIWDFMKRKRQMLAEEFIEGVEVTSGIWGEEVLPLLEIRPPKGEMFDFKNKYNGKTQEIPFSPSLTPEMQGKVSAITEKIRKALNIRDFSRVDYMVRGKEIFALELNTIPGMTSESLLPKAIKATGMTMEDALDLLIKSRQWGRQTHSN